MKKICYTILFAVFLLSFFSLPTEASQSGRTQYDKALRFTKEKHYDFALMEFRSIIREFPESIYAQEAMFAIAEYFYIQNIYHKATKDFSEYIRKYPDSDAAIFARAYLFKITQLTEKSLGQEQESTQDIEMDFFSQPLFLLFSEYKETSCKSAFQNKFTIRYYIDMIEVYRNDTLFIKITK